MSAEIKAMLDARADRRDYTSIWFANGVIFAARSNEYQSDGTTSLPEFTRCTCGAMARDCDNGEQAWIECPHCLVGTDARLAK